MLLATLVIPGREWWLPAFAIVALALVLLTWAYSRAAAPRVPVRAACLLLKLLGFLALAGCLIEPLWSGQRARPGANFFVVLADNSQGMQIKDAGENRTRAQVLQSLLAAPESSWQQQLKENFQVRNYFFDSRLQNTPDFFNLTFDGRSSALGTALRTIADRYRGQPLAGVLLLTDGNATDLSDGKIELPGLPPVYPVVIGRDEPIRDITLSKVAVSQTAFEDTPVTIQADVTAGGYVGTTLVAQLLDENGRKVDEQTGKAPRSRDSLAFRFQIRPEKPGISFYRVRVSARDELEQFDKPQRSTEATLANNNRVVVVDRGRGPFRVLYVAGRPNWEFKFLNRAVAEDEQIQLVGLIRIAKREPRFEFRGYGGDSSNPLFRGFDRQTDETERYDQPVLVRLNTRDASELVGGFPKTAEELYSYQAVVLDDLESEFFSRDQLALLQKFVSERGGGLLMLGGNESFFQGNYLHTPVADMLPVYLDRQTEAAPAGDFRLALTREGWLQPWVRVRSNEADENARLNSMPPFQVLNRVRDIKPGASVIANVTDARGQSYPALAVQRFGLGRVGALMVGDMWRWGLHEENAQKDLAKAWRQMIRWLVADVPERIQLTAEFKPADADQAMQLSVRARDRRFQPLDDATATITVRSVADSPTKTNTLKLAAEAALTEPGLYEATYIPRETGGYVAEVAVTDGSGLEVGKAETGWTADPAAEEFRSLNPNRALLEMLARQTKGELVAADKLNDFALNLPKRRAPITESWSYPLWHQPAVFLFALGCFIAEWALRRWKGMA